MRIRLAWALLAISVALNLFFVGGVVFSKLHERDGDQVSDARIAAITEELGLGDAERDGLVALRTAMRERWQAMRGNREELHDAMVDALLDPALDRDAALALAQQRSGPRDAAVADSMVALHAYLAGLSEAQRRGFAAMARDSRFFREIFGRPRPRPRD